jgi:hypothetical protein
MATAYTLAKDDNHGDEFFQNVKASLQNHQNHMKWLSTQKRAQC